MCTVCCVRRRVSRRKYDAVQCERWESGRCDGKENLGKVTYRTPPEMADILGLFRGIPEKDIGLGIVFLLVAGRVAVVRRHTKLVQYYLYSSMIDGTLELGSWILELVIFCYASCPSNFFVLSAGRGGARGAYLLSVCLFVELRNYLHNFYLVSTYLVVTY